MTGQGEYGEAAVAYEAAGDLDNVVRLSLEHLKSPHRAAALVRRAGSREAAQRLAHHCLAARDYQVSQEKPMSIPWGTNLLLVYVLTIRRKGPLQNPHIHITPYFDRETYDSADIQSMHL